MYGSGKGIPPVGEREVGLSEEGEANVGDMLVFTLRSAMLRVDMWAGMPEMDA